MRELHLPDGKPVVINPQLVAYFYSFGEDTTLIGFSGSGTITVQGSYEDVLVELGLLDDIPAHPEAAPDDEHDEFDDVEEDHLVEDEDEVEPEQHRAQPDRTFPF